MKKTFVLCLLAFICGMNALFASHFMGAEMSYEHLGGCNYRLYQTVYYDCSSNVGAYIPPNINNPYPAGGVSFSAIPLGCSFITPNQNWIVYSTSDVTNICPGSFSMCYPNGNPSIGGALEVTYYQDVSFCNTTCNTVTVQYNTCCRSYLPTSGAGGASLHTELVIPLNISNSSPRFVAPPITYVPTGQTSVFQQPAFDADGDSLVYSFAPCWENPGQTVTYNPGYSPAAPLGASWTCSINSLTGEITIVPTPGNIVTGVLGIQVDEYRNGTYIGRIRRDMQVSVKNVNSAVNAEPTAVVSNVSGVGFQNPPSVLRTAAGNPLSFQLTVTDANAGQLLDYTSNILSQFPTATITSSGNTSPMVLTFSWTPDTMDSGKNYPLVINAFDDNCELNGHYYFLTNIEIDSAYLSAVIIDANCTFPTGAIDLTILGGNSPYSYSWNNGDTTEDLVNIPSGPYIVLITDVSGNTWLPDTFYVNSLGLSANINATTPDCSISNGALGIDMLGGTAPYTYTWSNGQMGDSISGLNLGGYAVDVYDAIGCFYHTTTVLNYDPLDSCFSTIAGILYFDENGNCVQDPLEVGVANYYIDLTPGGAAFTDANGYYSFIVHDTGTFTVQTYVSNGANTTSNCLPPNFTQNCYIPLLGIDSLEVDFPMIFQPDLEVYLTEGWYIPGSNHYTNIACYNVSAYPLNAVLTYIHDTVLINPVFTPAPTTYNPLTYTATWDINNFLPGNNFPVSIISTTDPNALLGDIATSSAIIFPVANDATPFNNQDEVTMIVATSYDPNYKEVSPQGQTIHGLIPPNTENLEYTIHFQNTGTWQATYVILRDTIDIAHLDITSTEIQLTSHVCSITVENDSILVFTFNNINLPDSFTNEPASHGFVKFGIKLKPNLPLYTAIQNQASIYFDFNAPVITNATTNTLYNDMNLAVTTNIYICPNDSVLANVTDGRSPYQFDWSNGQQSLNNLLGISQIPANFASGTHNVQVTDYYGLTTAESFILNVVPVADASFSYTTVGNTYYCYPNMFNNIAYLWDFGNGDESNSDSASVTYTQSGTYTITLITIDMCGRADTTSQNITLTVGIDNTAFAQHVTLSPNPTAGFTILSFENEAAKPYTLRISDVNGKVIETFFNVREEKIRINTNQKAKGTYFWELKGEASARGIMLVE